MRLTLAFFVLVTVSTPALASIAAGEPSLVLMINRSTLIFRGQVLQEISSRTEELTGVKEHQSEVLIERVYIGAPAAAVVRIKWKEYPSCPRAFLKKNDYALFFLRASGSEFVLVDEEYGKLAVSHWQDPSQSLDPFIAIERDLKLAVQNDSGRQRIDDLLLLGSLGPPMSTAELRALLPSNDVVLESAVHLALLELHEAFAWSPRGYLRLASHAPSGCIT